MIVMVVVLVIVIESAAAAATTKTDKNVIVFYGCARSGKSLVNVSLLVFNSLPAVCTGLLEHQKATEKEGEEEEEKIPLIHQCVCVCT